MTKEITIEQFRNAIKKMPSDEPKVQPGIWYKTQKEHWLGWLKYYRGAGAYRRKGGKKREAKFAYNHVVNFQMLIWIIEAAGVDKKLIKKAKSVIDDKKTMQANAGAIRKIVSWELLADALWSNTR
jgi:hypothetical protein